MPSTTNRYIFLGKTDRNEKKHSRKKASSNSHHKSSHRSKDERSSRVDNYHTEKETFKFETDTKKITDEDYFRRQPEFRVWLAQTKNKYLDDLSTNEAIKLFTTDFMKKWNHGKLARMFYHGLPEAVVEQTKRTRHCWGFVAKLGEKEKLEVATAKDSVNVATKKEDLLTFHDEKRGDNKDAAMRGGEGGEKRNKYRNHEKNSELHEENQDQDQYKTKRRKVGHQREREYCDTVLDELLPKATGREAQIEKRRQVGARLHGPARDREDARDGLDLSEDFLMGGSGDGVDNLKRQIAYRNLARRRKQEEQEKKTGRVEGEGVCAHG
ncbi:unnamed protein product [Peronospora belbahrii]|uniref:Uncharacterized protein n=1 Tax=Peronospora belbahrii TaxID=622444 RepID=A0AAU9KZQ1_9STRA|nr:unnamed protein product [Peronospora belbahrii]